MTLDIVFAHIANLFLVTGPSHWGKMCNSGRTQSPINIKSAEATFDKDLVSFTFKNYDMKPTNESNDTFTGKNNGHTLTFLLPGDVYGVSGGGLVGNYSTVGFHLHWGSTNIQGSEHNLDGEKFAAEVSEGELSGYPFIQTY